MIRINLLPGEAGKKKTRTQRIAGPKSSGLVIFILVVAYLTTAGIAGIVAKTRIDVVKELSTAQKEKNGLQKEINELKAQYIELIEIEELYKNQVEILKALSPPDRIFWSEKLNMLSAMIPENVYITRMEMVEEQKQIQTTESQRKIEEWEKLPKEKQEKTPKPEPVMKPLISQNLKIEGIVKATTPDGALELVVDFHKRMKTYSQSRPNGETSRFDDQISDIRLTDTKMGNTGGVDVHLFEFEIKTEPFISQ